MTCPFNIHIMTKSDAPSATRSKAAVLCHRNSEISNIIKTSKDGQIVQKIGEMI